VGQLFSLGYDDWLLHPVKLLNDIVEAAAADEVFFLQTCTQFGNGFFVVLRKGRSIVTKKWQESNGSCLVPP
jgi:hypothetical protein